MTFVTLFLKYIFNDFLQLLFGICSGYNRGLAPICRTKQHHRHGCYPIGLSQIFIFIDINFIKINLTCVFCSQFIQYGRQSLARAAPCSRKINYSMTGSIEFPCRSIGVIIDKNFKLACVNSTTLPSF